MCGQFRLDCLKQDAGIHILTHTGALGRHDMPIADIHQQTVYIGPIAAHTGFYRMDAAIVIKKYAIPISPLRQDRALTGKPAIVLQAIFFRNTQVTRYRADISTSHVGAPISLAACTALGTGEWFAT
jgi:hypothetical protein